MSLKFRSIIVFILMSACIDRINFNIPQTQSQIVVDGMISDAAGPYTVKLSQAISLSATSAVRSPIEKANIKLFDDDGNVEDFTEIGPGVYETGGIIQGQVGHAYHVTIATEDGKLFESEPDMMYPAGNVENINYEYEAGTIQTSYGTIDNNIFNIYIDADANTSDNYVRWRFTGTYKIRTYPELHETLALEYYYRTPPDCSGYIVRPGLGGGILTQVAPCTCCICWVTQYELSPTVSDGQYISENQFKHVKLAEVPINNATFYEKYFVEVEQMSLSRTAYDFFRLIRSQYDGTGSLFQPPSGQVNGNLRAVNSSDAILGLFYASSVKSKSIFISRDDVPYKVTGLDTLAEACTFYSNSVTSKPLFWQ